MSNDGDFSIPLVDAKASEESDERLVNSIERSNDSNKIIQLDVVRDSKLVLNLEEVKKFVSNSSQSILDSCTYLRSRGFCPLPTQPRSKSLKRLVGTPYDSDIMSSNQETDKKSFEAGDNISLLLGQPFKNSDYSLVDLDIEVDEARVFAHNFFKSNNTACFGRRSAPKGHYLFFVPTRQIGPCIRSYHWPPEIRSRNPNDKDSGLILEIKTSGHSLCPPSTHPSGELLFWMSDEKPDNISFATFIEYARKIAIGTILMSSWSKGVRDKLVVGFAGYVLSNGWTLKATTEFMSALFSCVWPITMQEKQQWLQRIVDFDSEIRERKSKGQSLEDNDREITYVG